VPPVAPSVCEYGAVTSPCGNGEVVVMLGAAWIAKLNILGAEVRLS
jgi:hypothetical protein